MFKNLNKNNYEKVNPYFVSGFSDAESTFGISIYKKKEYKTGWHVRVEFAIGIHAKDKALLYQIQSFFGGVGQIYEYSEKCHLRVFSSKDLTNVIIPHFDKYPLITKKRADFLLFKMAVVLMNKKEHLTIEGLKKIVSIKASMNLGLTAELIDSFPNIVPVDRPIVELHTEKIDPNWLAGFVSGEGCFHG
jgi:hypothetical protein